MLFIARLMPENQAVYGGLLRFFSGANDKLWQSVLEMLDDYNKKMAVIIKSIRSGSKDQRQSSETN